MSSRLSEEREAVARARDVQDHEAGFRTRLIFWRAKRRFAMFLTRLAFVLMIQNCSD